MSTGERIELSRALEIVAAHLADIGHLFERIEIAGSVRRKCATVGDLEFVCIPRIVGIPDMLGVINDESDLDIADTLVRLGAEFRVNGQRQKGYTVPGRGAKIELYIVRPPAQWGVNFMIRTGSAEFSHRMVTSKHYGGALPSWAHVAQGAVWNGKEIIPMAEEADYFKLCGMEVIAPEFRVR